MIDPIELNALADGELSPKEAEALRRRLEASPEDLAAYDSIVRVKQLLSTHSERVECRTEWKACVGRLDELDRTRRAERFVGRYAWVLCGVFFLAITAGGLTSRDRKSDSVTVSDLSRVATILNPRQTPPIQNEAREKLLDDLLGEARQSVDPRRMDIVGYSAGHLDGRPVTAFTLRDPNGTFGLLVLPGVLDLEGTAPLSDRAYKMGHLQGLNCIAWTDGQSTFSVVGDRAYEDLVAVATALQPRTFSR